ncbi:hypothetical protein L5G32_10930 [Gordonia sp. HY002]|uniref:hypothetical protein n=1 Tax=Gordonia zhenghanii TaxID=2911516 RepID=UPI001EF16115|nr:hypothetical protein [Gordonia zhenghanii]MCF8570781.1 hypothetical protein [Gordonia zhenghanii]MCF8603784.1 hypothetical protein [Gordonia zhenghanii]
MSMIVDDRTKGVESRKTGNSARPSGARAHAGATRRGRAGAVDRSTRSKAAQRALDRRQRRMSPDAAVSAVARKRVGGVPLVFPVLLLIAGALGLTLYLTTKSAQDSYALDAMREQNQTLQDKRDDLKRQHDLADSAPALAAKAGDLGMVPSQGAVQIVIGADGKAHRVGAPTVSEGGRLPDLNPAPDPVDKIDPKGVDDSVGLQGTGDSAAPTTGAPNTAAPNATTPAPNTTAPNTAAPNTAAPNTAAPNTTAPSDRPAPNVRPNADPSRQVSRQQTNVTPPVDATPERNAEPAR